ncbi:MAG: hypothetical protein ACO36I_03730 [Candidatus Latescibacterota bacterium]
MVFVIALGSPKFITAQISSTEQAVMDKILKLKAEIDQLMMKPGSSSDKVAMDKVMDMKRDIDTFLDLLPPHLQTQVQNKMAQSVGQAASGLGGMAEPELPFVMAPQELQKVEMALMRNQLHSLKRIGGVLRQSGHLDAQTQGLWVAFLESVAGSGMPANVGLMTKYVMREAFAAENEGLESLGGKLRFYRDMRSKMKAEIEKVEKMVNAVPEEDGPLLETIKKKQFSLGLNGEAMVREGEEVSQKEGAKQYLKTLKNDLAQMNEQAEKVNLELEAALLKQQPKMKMMSEVSQKLQEAGMAVVQEGH